MTIVAGYFAFGSNMNPARVRARGLRFDDPQSAALANFQLVFDKCADPVGAGHANIRYCPGKTVHGVLYVLPEPGDILRMDPFEHAPINYGREVFNVRTIDGALVPAWTYIGNTAVLRDGLLPTRDYLAHLLSGAPWLPDDYCQELRQWPCLLTTP